VTPESTRAGTQDGSLTSAADRAVPPPPATGDTFPLLDSLRGLGAVCVVLTHTAFWSGDYTRHGTLGTVLARLDVGVAIFFVLSGFLLSRAWLARAADGLAAPRVRPYLWRRALRIVPLYVFTVVLAMVFVHDNRGASFGSWVSTLLMLDTFHQATFPAGLTQMWSLAVEVSFYLLLPLVMWLLVGRTLRPRRVVAGLVVLAAVTVWWHLAGASPVGEGQPLQWLPAFLTWFGAGIALALVEVLHSRGHGSRAVRALVSLGRQPGSCWTLAVALLLAAATPLAGPSMFTAPTPAESLTRNLLYAGVGGLLVLSGVFADRRGTYARWAGSPLPRRLGWLSYGIFCLHLPILHLVMWTTGWELFEGRMLQISAIALVASVVAAEVSYRLLERPALRLKDLGRRRTAGRERAVDQTSTASGGTSA